jgi:hypothetical protein
MVGYIRRSLPEDPSILEVARCSVHGKAPSAEKIYRSDRRERDDDDDEDDEDEEEEEEEEGVGGWNDDDGVTVERSD